MSAPLHIRAAGMVTAVGLDAPSSCAAMRAWLDGFAETRFVGPGGEPLTGAPVVLPHNWVGEKRMAHIAAAAIAECLAAAPDARTGRVQLILCLAEPARPGRLVEHGRPSGIVALDQARRLLAEDRADHVLIAGVDSYLTTLSMVHYLAGKRLLSPGNADGFIAGEAAAAVLCSPGRGGLRLTGLGLAREKAFAYNGLDEDGQNLPLRGDGMVAAYRAAMDEANVDLAHVEYRISDLIGEQYFFKQTALASLRLERGRKEFQDLWSPAESVGNVGAAVVPMMLGMALTAAEKGYAGGSPALVEASGDDGACGAAILHEVRGQ